MQRTHTLISFLLVGLLLVAGTAAARVQPFSGAEILDDPEWRKNFLGSYGFLNGAEPQISQAELTILRDVLDTMKVNPRAAATMLSAQAGPDSSAALDFILANLYFMNGDLAPAVATYEQSLEKFPDFRRAHKNLGLLNVQQQKFDVAVSHLSRAIELGDRDGRTYGLLGYCHINLENALAAEIAYRGAVLAQPETKDWRLGLARALLAQEKYREAVSLFDQLIAEDPSNSNAWMLQANAYLGLDDPRQAAVNLEAVRLMGKADPQGLKLLGDIYMNEQMYALAKSAYLEVIAADRDGVQFDTAYRAADLLIRAGSYRQARDLIQSIEKRYGKSLDSDSELALLTLSAKLARAEGRKKEAAALLESIVQRDGTRGEALLELASYYHEQGQVEKATLLVERAQNIDAFEYRALIEQARFMVSARDYEGAAELLERAMKIKTEPRVARFLASVHQAMNR